GSGPSRGLLGTRVLAAACRWQWHDLDLWAGPSGRSGLGAPGLGGAVRWVVTVLVGLRSPRGTDQAGAGEGTDPGANHVLGGQPPPEPMTDVIVQSFLRRGP